MPADNLQDLIDSSPVHRALRLRVASTEQGRLRLTADTGPDHTGEDGSQFLQLQYTQTVLLVFDGVIWPHISVATLIKR